MALISVILPVYNGEQTIRETIRSVLNQTCQDFELIIINDGSEDGTLEIIEPIQDPRIKVLSYSNAGPNPSRNRGLVEAKGEYIAFIDADDLWTSDKLASQLQALQAHPQAAVAYSWTDYIDASGQFLRRGSHMSLTGDVLRHLLLMNFLESGSNPLIRQEALATVGGFDESLTHGEEWDMWLRLAAQYQFVAVPSPQVFYRVYGHSSSTKIAQLEVGCLQVINKAFSQAPESLQYLKGFSQGNLYKYLISKALAEPLERRRSLIAARFLGQAVRHDPSLLQAPVLLKVLFRIGVIVFLPAQVAQTLLTKARSWFDIQALQGYLRMGN
ncbi:MAG: glycosyltransferase [Symploca sp. SIO2D2]|nr:glycosyltransferase [Symploca sp. SIO2D2]